MKASLLWICFSLIAVTAGQISVRKCCQSGEVLTEALDKFSDENPSCIKHDGKILN